MIEIKFAQGCRLSKKDCEEVRPVPELVALRKKCTKLKIRSVVVWETLIIDNNRDQSEMPLNLDIFEILGKIGEAINAAESPTK